MKNRECENCGADNELIVSNCSYCGKSLVSEENIEKETDELEDLIQNCSAWIGKYEAMVSDIGTLSNAKQIDSMSAQPIFGSLMAKSYGSNAVSYSETLSNVHHYLDLLEIKSSESSILREKVAQFKMRFERAKKKEKDTQQKKVKLIIGLVSALILIIVFSLIMANI